MADLYLMCGIPGCGKSTFLTKVIDKNSVIISRDAIRFSIVKPDEDYFSHENEVVKEFWKQINESLAAGKDVFVDQTSITPNSRSYLLKHIKGYTYANIIWINEDIKTCIKRNEMRKGTRAYVPPYVIYRMAKQFIEPSLEEGFDYIFCYNSKDNKITFKGGVVK